jgi:CRISPR/Cas system CMR subunit Cmr6 (Cas7 group RAMP superfamily)
MPSDTRSVLGENAVNCDSRSLLFDRFADPAAPKDDRRAWFQQVIRQAAKREKAQAWRQWLAELPASNPAEILFAHLQSRLMVNMAGGVMENAGLCLDRFGLPYIPGSAVKGCARRMAIQRLLEAETPEAEDKSAKKADLLFQIALIFGWTDTDWKDGRKPKKDGSQGELFSDFEYGCGEGERWRCIWEPVVRTLLDRLDVRVRKHPKEPWLDVPNFAGSVSFLPAYPVDLGNSRKVAGVPLELPQLGKLELDVVTCHHPDYYSQKKDSRGHLLMPVALDVEDPNPVVFPAVAPGHIFTFALRPLRDCDPMLVANARTWLSTGLSTFGLGAKTNAGYGWFDASEALQQAVRGALETAAQKRREEQQRREEEERRKADEDERRRKAAELKAATANMTPEQKADYEVAQLTDDQFRGRLDSFVRRDSPEQEAMVRAMRLAQDQPGSRRRFWDDLRAKAQRGGKPAQIEQAVRQMSRQMFPGKAGRMP